MGMMGHFHFDPCPDLDVPAVRLEALNLYHVSDSRIIEALVI